MKKNLDFFGQNTLYATHGMHSFAAKCPPQLVQYGLEAYSKSGDTVLDPMTGSGTTLVEAQIHGRNAIGVDIDPLACLISRVKSRILDNEKIEKAYLLVRGKVIQDISKIENRLLSKALLARMSPPDFLNRDYWFAPIIQRDLALLSFHIHHSTMDEEIREFLWVAFSGIILSKVSVANARDIIHSRHHFFSHKTMPNVLEKFDKRIRNMRRQMDEFREICKQGKSKIKVLHGDARRIPVRKNSIDLVFTSPPYATALDYPRALFLAVSWMKPILGVSHDEYKDKGNVYIGSERGRFEKNEVDSSLGKLAQITLSKIILIDPRKANVVQRYFQDMYKVLLEINRVLKPQKHAVIVVCPSHIRKIQVPTHKIFSEMASKVGLTLVEEHVRNIDSSRRLLPHVRGKFGNRMDTEYVLVYQKRS